MSIDNARDEKWSEWIEWSGGKCPLTNGTEYNVKFRSGGLGGVENQPEGLDWKHNDIRSDIIAYRYKIKELVKCLDNAWDEPTPEEDEAWQAKEQKQNKSQYSAYFKDVRHIDTLDVYRVVSLFDCEKHGHPISHAAKKLLLSGSRTGGKDVESDVREAIDTLHRWLEMREEDARA